MSTTKILPDERKFVKMIQLMDKIISNDLENTIDEMLNKDPRMLCRLNLKNSQVAKIIDKKIASGQLHPFDLMYEPEETLVLEGISRTAHDAMNRLTAEDEAWLETLTDKFKKRTKEQALKDKEERIKAARARKLDESRDNCLALPLS